MNQIDSSLDPAPPTHVGDGDMLFVDSIRLIESKCCVNYNMRVVDYNSKYCVNYKLRIHLHLYTLGYDMLFADSMSCVTCHMS